MDITELLENIKNDTLEISAFLSEKDEFHSEEISRLSYLYLNREKKINELKSLYDSNSLQQFIGVDREYWKKFLSFVLEKDKENLDKVDNIIKDISSNLRAIINKKSLLIYLK